MRKEDCYQLGHISRLHGIKGEVIAFFDTDQPQRYKNLESVFVDIRGELVPFFIEEMAQNSKGHFILKLEDTSAEEAESLINRELFLPLSFLPPLSGKKFYFHEVIGFEAYDQNQNLLGTISQMLDNSAQPLFKIVDAQNNEILIPAVDAFITALHRDKSTIELQLPDGLLEIYRP